MGGPNVKNTMIERVLQIIAPHPCSGCGKLGVVLCDDCKYNIIHEPFLGCILCGKPEPRGVCLQHNSPISRAFTVSLRTEALEDAINRLKFSNTKYAANDLAGLLAWYLPVLPFDSLLIPLPTVRSHIRKRGYDQVDLIARHLSKLINISIARPLMRVGNATQHLVGREDRFEQAKNAYSLNATANINGKVVLLLDDVVTTGSSLLAAATLLASTGATVWAVTLAYQPLD